MVDADRKWPDAALMRESGDCTDGVYDVRDGDVGDVAPDRGDGKEAVDCGRGGEARALAEVEFGEGIAEKPGEAALGGFSRLSSVRRVWHS